MGVISAGIVVIQAPQYDCADNIPFLLFFARKKLQYLKKNCLAVYSEKNGLWWKMKNTEEEQHNKVFVRNLLNSTFLSGIFVVIAAPLLFVCPMIPHHFFDGKSEKTPFRRALFQREKLYWKTEIALQCGDWMDLAQFWIGEKDEISLRAFLDYEITHFGDPRAMLLKGDLLFAQNKPAEAANAYAGALHSATPLPPEAAVYCAEQLKKLQGTMK